MLSRSALDFRWHENPWLDFSPMASRYELRQMFRVGCRNNRRPSHSQTLRGEQHVDIESRDIGGRPSPLPGLGPQLRRKAKGIIRQWHVPVRGGVHECLKARDASGLVRARTYLTNHMEAASIGLWQLNQTRFRKQ